MQGGGGKNAPPTVLAKVKRREEEDKVVKRKVGSGPRKMDPKISRIIKKKVTKNPTITAKQLRLWSPILQKVSVRTIQKICKDVLKPPSRKAAKKPLLTQHMKDQRLEFARLPGLDSGRLEEGHVQ